MTRSFFLIVLVIALGCSTKSKRPLTIATAANVQFAMEALADQFKRETGIDSEIILGSSGQLCAQIKAGAPYDVFVSANMKYPQDIFENKLAQSEPVIYGKGVLVLWSKNLIPDLNKLTSDSINKIAVANPSTAPYGEAAVEVLKKFNALESVTDKLVYGESISQVNQFIISSAVDVGFTSKSVVVSTELKETGHWVEVDRALYNPIEQGIVLIKGSNEDAAKLFFEFIFSEKGKKILIENGYRVD